MSESPKNQIELMAARLSIEPQELHNVVLNTLMPSGKQPTNEQFVSFLAVANEYNLNPMTKEIYAFPTKGGGIQPIVSIDGWLKIINSHPHFDGMEFEDKFDDENLFSVTCRIYNKDRKHPTEVTEYLSECQGDTKDKYNNLTPWGRWPARMLRHKALIQAARYAFGFSGIVDPDEAERIKESQGVEKEVQGTSEVVGECCSDEKFNQNFDAWSKQVSSGKKTASEIAQFLETKGVILSPSMIADLKAVEPQVIEG